MADRHSLVRERVTALPDAIRDCESCGSDGSMQIRRSSLRPRPCADDITLKCSTCRRIRTHGVPLTRFEFEEEMAMRGTRTLDFVNDGPGKSVEENLQALGYKEF